MSENVNFVEPLIDDIFKRRSRMFAREQQDRKARALARTTKRNPVASNAHIECRREMTLRLTNPHDAPEFDEFVLARMRHGTMIGNHVRREFEDWGMNVVHGESPILIRDRKGRKAYTGMIDFGVQPLTESKMVVPVEVKSMSQFAFDAIFTVEDLQKKFWTKKYLRQLLIYLLGRDIPEGILCLYHRGHLKLIPVRLYDFMEEAEECLQSAEAALDAAESGDLPPFAEDPEECRRCNFFGSVCNPPLDEDLTVFSDPEFESDLNEYLDIKPTASRAEALKKKLSKRVLAVPAMNDGKVARAVSGKVGIESKEGKRGSFLVPASVFRVVKYFRTEEVKVEGGPE